MGCANMAWADNHLFWAMRKWIRQGGWPMWLLFLLMFACVLFSLLVWQPQRQREQNFRTPLPNLRLATRLEGGITQAVQLAQFYQTFPEQAQLSDAVGKVYTIASTRNLILEQGKYNLVVEKGNILVRYEMILPVKGAYPQVRQFVSDALKQLPHLVLTSIIFNRKKIDETSVEAELHFTMYLRGE